MAEKNPSFEKNDDGREKMDEALTRIEVALRQKNARQLNLNGLNLTTLPDSLGRLVTLEKLDLDENQLETLPHWFSNLRMLEILDLSANHFASLPEPLCKLSALRHLVVYHNKLSLLPESFGRLVSLRYLSLWDNQFAIFPPQLQNLRALEHLDIAGNRFAELPDWIGELVTLKNLDLEGNMLRRIPNSVQNLIKLERLNFSDNDLTVLPKSLRKLSSLKKLFLHRNPKLRLPSEILGITSLEAELHSKKTGATQPADPRAVLAFYFAQRQRGAKPLNEVKLLLVGHGRVGKTSLSKALRDVAHDALEPETPGIERHPVALMDGQSEITGHIWDFGGQEFLHQTHQFFFSERSVYLVVLAGRDRNPMQEAEYWLRLIRTYGSGSPVIIILNKICEHAFTIDGFNLQDRYPEVKAVVEVDCHPHHKIVDLKKLLGRLAGVMPGVKEKIDPRWASVRTELENMDVCYVSYQEYQSICGKFGVETSEKQETLAVILNCLGIALNYRNDPRLRDQTVLKPRWIVDGIYSILRWLQKQKRNGLLNRDDFTKALINKKIYPEETYKFLLALMEKFELCFPLDQAADSKRFLVPGLLSENQPQEMGEFLGKAARRIQFRYDDLRPPGLIPRFIVRSHTLSEKQPRWRRGVVLARGKARALVRGDHAGRVTDIFAIGESEDRVWLTEFILGEMKALNDKLPVKTLIESESQPGAWTELEILQAADQKGEKTRAERTSDQRTVQIDIKQTLREVESPEATRQQSGKSERLKHDDCAFPLFICYSHQNERIVKQLKPTLTVLARRGYILPWRDTDLVPGEDWNETIKERLTNAQIILFMVSREFIASPYITAEERPLAMSLMNEGKAVVVPILLKPSNWNHEDFASLENLPKKGEFISSFSPRDEAWVLVEKGIIRAVEKLRAGGGEKI